MMDDLIKRQDAISTIQKYNFDFPQYMERFVTELRDAMKADLEHDIRNLPQKTGKWIHRISPDEYHCGILECPFCGWEEVDTEHLICCARCGARMAGSEEKE